MFSEMEIYCCSASVDANKTYALSNQDVNISKLRQLFLIFKWTIKVSYGHVKLCYVNDDMSVNVLGSYNCDLYWKNTFRYNVYKTYFKCGIVF